MRKETEGRHCLLPALAALVMLTAGSSCTAGQVEQQPLAATPALETISRHCEEQLGDPRIERVSEHVWASQGYDLANTVLIHTDEGNIIVDTSLNPAAARVVK